MLLSFTLGGFFTFSAPKGQKSIPAAARGCWGMDPFPLTASGFSSRQKHPQRIPFFPPFLARKTPNSTQKRLNLPKTWSHPELLPEEPPLLLPRRRFDSRDFHARCVYSLILRRRLISSRALVLSLKHVLVFFITAFHGTTGTLGKISHSGIDRRNRDREPPARKSNAADGKSGMGSAGTDPPPPPRAPGPQPEEAPAAPGGG